MKPTWKATILSALLAVAILPLSATAQTPSRSGAVYQALTLSAHHANPFKLGAGRLDIDHALNCGPIGGTCNP